MSEDFSDLINNVKNMVDNGNIPDEMKNIISSISSDKKVNNSNNSSGQISNLDFDTIIKIKKILENINDKNDPRTNLLYSLKPYLRENKKNKLDQYVNFLNITKIANIINNEKKENNSDV